VESDFLAFLREVSISAEVNIYSIGNLRAEVVVAGLELVQVKQFLDEKCSGYKDKKLLNQ